MVKTWFEIIKKNLKVTLLIDAPKYEVIKSDLVQPVTLKQSIILPNEGLETIKQCKDPYSYMKETT